MAQKIVIGSFYILPNMIKIGPTVRGCRLLVIVYIVFILCTLMLFNFFRYNKKT